MPRKKINPENKKVTISITLHPKILETVTEIAEHGNLTISATIQELIMYGMRVVYEVEKRKEDTKED